LLQRFPIRLNPPTARQEKAMGKGNHSQKNDKKMKKPKQEKKAPPKK
jgi:hypothetical protein